MAGACSTEKALQYRRLSAFYLLLIRNSRVAGIKAFSGSRRRRIRWRRSVDQSGRRGRRGIRQWRERGIRRWRKRGVRRWRRRGVRRWRRRDVRRRRSEKWRRRAVVRCQREEHVVGESGLVGAWTTKVHAATLTAGDRRSVRQRHRGVATVPADDYGVGGGSILEAARQQCTLFVSGIETTPKNGPISRCIRNPRRKPRTIGTGGRISTRNIRRSGDLTDQRHQCCNNDHGQRG
jgi:hypothetical protein